MEWKILFSSLHSMVCSKHTSPANIFSNKVAIVPDNIWRNAPFVLLFGAFQRLSCFSLWYYQCSIPVFFFFFLIISGSLNVLLMLMLLIVMTQASIFLDCGVITIFINGKPTSLITKNIVVFPAFSVFAVKLIFVLLLDQHRVSLFSQVNWN